MYMFSTCLTMTVCHMYVWFSQCFIVLMTSKDVTLTLMFSNVSSHHLRLKVDMFSYGMVLYELLSGRRPSLGQHQLQIAKKLSKGVRPVLGSPEEVQFCCLHSMLIECWDTKPEKVRGVVPLSY